MLRLDLKVGESLVIGEVVITMERKSGQQARLSIRAPRDVAIRKALNDGTPGEDEKAQDFRAFPA